jgi:hypothetical protein
MAPKKKTYGTTRSGRTIDDDLVDELAEKAERGYDVGSGARSRSAPRVIKSPRPQ